jgi:hypothetical protein
MAQYSPEFLASLQHRYEKTDQPMIELAREFGIGITTLQSLVDKHGFEKRSQRLRGLPRAMHLQREAEALAARGSANSEETAVPSFTGAEGNASARVETPRALSPCAEREKSLAEGGRMAVFEDGRSANLETPPTPDLTLSGRRSESARSGDGPANAVQSPIERLERLVVQEIADLESARDLRAGKRVSGAGAERTAQALASLTRTLQTIRAMRGETVAVDDEVEDIDAFRLRLAKKIEDFLARRESEDFGADGEDDLAPTDTQGSH